MEWKKIVKVILRRPLPDPPLKGREAGGKEQGGNGHGRTWSVMRLIIELILKLAAITTSRWPRSFRLKGGLPPNQGGQGESPLTAAPVGATYSSNCSKPLPRWQVLSLLQWDCLHSERRIDLLVLHCSDTRPTQQYTIGQLQLDHQRRGFGPWPGYHIYVRRDGGLFYCRPVAEAGCHAKGFNLHSIGICYEGGRSSSADVRHEDNRTAEQVEVLDEVLRTLHALYPEARITGHHDLNPLKACPCLSPPTAEQYAYIFGKPSGA